MSACFIAAMVSVFGHYEFYFTKYITVWLHNTMHFGDEKLDIAERYSMEKT